jgi:hypothetical protein
MASALQFALAGAGTPPLTLENLLQFRAALGRMPAHLHPKAEELEDGRVVSEAGVGTAAVQAVALLFGATGGDPDKFKDASDEMPVPDGYLESLVNVYNSWADMMMSNYRAQMGEG